MILSWLTSVNLRLFGVAVCNDPNDPNCIHIPTTPATHSTVEPILQIIFGIIGAVALIIVIVAGLQFVTSQGDPQSATRARQTALYAIIGLVVAVSAEAIVTFVLGKL